VPLDERTLSDLNEAARPVGLDPTRTAAAL